MEDALLPADVGGLTLAGSVGRAQDPVAVDPAHFKVELETDQVRVLRVTVGPHEKVPMQTVPPAVIVVLTDGYNKQTFEGGRTQEVNLKRGDIMSLQDSATFALENLTGELYESIRIELKGQTAEAQPPGEEQYAPRVPEGTTVHRELRYVKNGHERQTLDLYLPTAGKDLPLIIWGAWRRFSAGQQERRGRSYGLSRRFCRLPRRSVGVSR